MEAAHKFVNFFVDLSVHEDSPYLPPQRDREIELLARRCLDLALDQDIKVDEITKAVGDLAALFRTVIDRKNARPPGLAA